ncbi:MAG TPA: RNA helicase [Deltaproteobacteria bacterium]|nr:RNA helicase [Deltaproteobacteria bacterium]
METTSRSFHDLGLSEPLLHSLESAGYKHPTPIQDAAIPMALADHDLIGIAQTGTGKTLAFVLPLIEKLQGIRGTLAVILCPTREIALQTHHAIEKVGKPLKVHSVDIIGGRSLRAQAQRLEKHPSILVATPGRLCDHMERRNIDLNSVGYLVMDEADHMLDLGFLPQIRRILKALPKDRQTLMFSATMPAEITRLAQQYLNNPQRIEIAPPGTAAKGIEHALYLLDPQHKRNAILALLKEEKESTLVFTRTKLDAEWLCRLLQKENHSVEAIHSDRSQSERIKVLEGFKQGRFQILVATDIVARGIDVKGIAHVVNFDIPQSPEDYVHRAGRTARMNATGKASTLCTWVEMHFAEAIEKLLGFPLPRNQIPGIPAFEETPAVPMTPFGRSGRSGRRVRLR